MSVSESPAQVASAARIHAAYQLVRRQLLDERNEMGHWEGELSTSALSTATATMALLQYDKAYGQDTHRQLIADGLAWLAGHQNEDGGWGDTVRSKSNISTTMLVHAVFHATESVESHAELVQSAREYIERVGGIDAVRARYGKDKTFSVPILTHCALAGLVDWREVNQLPFELACVPPQFFAALRLPVVSYALPALIAIGLTRFRHRASWNPLMNGLRRMSTGKALNVLEKIQPPNGGFLEAAPLTSFVCMSLAACGLHDHAVTRRCVRFLEESVREDGSWPIDTNLATWVTTLSVNALQDDLPQAEREPIREWLLGQQYRTKHPYTNADPGGWAWTDLPGGVPDADDTPGAILALGQLGEGGQIRDARRNGVKWLLSLQNADGGWPTFCRGWLDLPFDRSAADISAHVIRAINVFAESEEASPAEKAKIARATERGMRYLLKVQRDDGSWLPLWFGHQEGDDDENPVFGTSRVLAAFSLVGMKSDVIRNAHQRGLEYLLRVQNADGGWGGAAGLESSIEETALATEVLSHCDRGQEAALRGAVWLAERCEQGRNSYASPIGFYFAKLWYFERLYPVVFTAAALRSVSRVVEIK